MSNKQIQKAGESSTNIQIQGDGTINCGLNYEDVRQIAIDVFKANFLDLKREAQNTAKQRCEELTSALIIRLENEREINLDVAKDPDIQYAIFSSQKDYARSGSPDLLNLLIDLLVNRFKVNDCDYKKIVLNEAIHVANKLTSTQIDTISLVFLIAESSNNTVSNLRYFENFITTLLPFCKNYGKGRYDYKHIEYVGCGNVSIMSTKFTDFLKTNYSGVLSKGFSQENARGLGLTSEQYKTLIIPCLRDNTKLQVNGLNYLSIKAQGESLGLTNEQIINVKNLQDTYLCTEDEILEILDKISPQLSILNNIWNSTSLGCLKLTTVGIAIAQANISRITGEKFELNIWLNSS